MVERVRAVVRREPIEHSEVQRWFDELNVSPELKPYHVTWRSDYESYYFERLWKRSSTWYLFRDEYLFVLSRAVISEVPMPGHATYVFAKPEDLSRFMRDYSETSRHDIRRNRDNVAATLGFIGRVARGKRKKRWLADVFKHAGEADSTGAVE